MKINGKSIVFVSALIFSIIFDTRGDRNIIGKKVNSKGRNVSETFLVDDDDIYPSNSKPYFHEGKVDLNDDEIDTSFKSRRINEGKVDIDDDEAKPPSKKVQEIIVKILDDDERGFKKKPWIYFDNGFNLADDEKTSKEKKLTWVKIYRTDDENIIKKLKDPINSEPFIVDDDEIDKLLEVKPKIPPTSKKLKPEWTTPDIRLNMIDVKRNIDQVTCNRNLTSWLTKKCEWGYQIKDNDPIKYDKESFCCAGKDFLKCLYNAFENSDCMANHDENLLIFILTHGMAQLDCYRYQKECHSRRVNNARLTSSCPTVLVLLLTLIYLRMVIL